MELLQLRLVTENGETATEKIISYGNFMMIRKLSVIIFLVNFLFLLIDYNNRAIGLWAFNHAYYYVFISHVVLGLATLMSILLSYKLVASDGNVLFFVRGYKKEGAFAAIITCIGFGDFEGHYCWLRICFPMENEASG